MVKISLTYKDDDGNKLFGFSVDDMKEYNLKLERNTFWIKMLVILGYIAFVYVLVMSWYVIHYNVLGNTLNIISKCF